MIPGGSRSVRTGGHLAAVLACAAAAFPLGPAAVQSQAPAAPDFASARYVGVGYVANAPDELFGAGAFVLLRSGFGLYLDAKMSHDSPGRESHFLADMSLQTAEALGDTNLREKDAFRSFNAALLRRISGDAAAYLGAGLSRRTRYHEFEDETGGRGFGGFYWVREPEATKNQLNVLGGILIHAGRHVVFQFGLETEPSGATVGAALGLPF